MLKMAFTSVMKSKTLVVASALVLALWSCTPPVRAKLEESYVRLQQRPDGTWINTYSDGKTAVTVGIGPQGALLDCYEAKPNSTVNRRLFTEAVTSDRSDTAATYRMEVIDVARIARKCRKFIRKMNRKRESKLTEEEREIRDRLSLDKPIEGTLWCSRAGPPPYQKRLGTNKTLDKCCRDFHKCDGSVEAFSFKDRFFNYLPWTMPSCDCAKAFQQCLRNNGKKEALQFGNRLFNVLRLPCTRVVEREVCTEYNGWFTECLKRERLKIPTADYMHME